MNLDDDFVPQEEAQMKTCSFAAVCSRPALVISFAVSSLVSLACGGSYPSESAGRKFLENIGTELETISSSGRIKGVFRVMNFTKTNGVSQGDSYTLEYEAELECLKVTREPGDMFLQTKYSVSCEQIGEVVKQSGKIEFQRTENGWRASDGRIY